MMYAVQVVDGERVVVRVPRLEPEGMVLADPAAGTEAANPPGSFEVLYSALTGHIPPVPEQAVPCDGGGDE